MNPAVRHGLEGRQALEIDIHRLIPDSLSAALKKRDRVPSSDQKAGWR
jgi:hypothetical protein